MEYTIMVGDKLIIWWPSGVGFDEYSVRTLNVMEGPERQIIYTGSYEMTSNGNYVKK